MKHTHRFYEECAQISMHFREFVGGLKAELAESDQRLRSLRGDDLTQEQGRAQGLERILNLFEDAERRLRQ